MASITLLLMHTVQRSTKSILLTKFDTMASWPSMTSESGTADVMRSGRPDLGGNSIAKFFYFSFGVNTAWVLA